MRSYHHFRINHPHDFLPRLLAWCTQRNENIALLNSNGYQPQTFDALAAIGSTTSFSCSYAEKEGALEKLDAFQQQHRDWMFGFLSYDVKDSIEDGSNIHQPHPPVPLIHFFIPTWLIRIQGTDVEIGVAENSTAASAEEVFDQISRTEPLQSSWPENMRMQCRMPRDTYRKQAETIIDHIRRGDIYEMNFCQEFYNEHMQLDAPAAFLHLSEHAPSPFSAYYKTGDLHVLSSSPERYLKREGEMLISQPMKGTIRKGKDKAEDNELIDVLRLSRKEQSENVMIVDLVRNDLSRIQGAVNVKVDELFGIQSFPRVHQMVSTISATLNETVSLGECIRATFPMGSMTGAPKIRAMELIDRYEATGRGLYSGALGYVDPEGNFDFNVMIRTLLYHADSGYTSLSTGSALTIQANIETEYEECLLKASSVLNSPPECKST
ncbi:MAG: anthranilate synthase component I family protein [Flavobacteriales bacterium]|nr:anthranilate synthase component I family protein [Flavobacteriales bacterium]